MKISLASVTPVAALAALTAASCDFVAGNYYCSQTNAVAYSNVGYSGSYRDVTSMDETSCTCQQEEVTFEGSLAPLDEELSVHFRGPLELLQFGVYYPASGASLKKRENCDVEVAHHAHKREAAVKIVEVTSTVWVDGEGNAAPTSSAGYQSSAVVTMSSLVPESSSPAYASSASSSPAYASSAFSSPAYASSASSSPAYASSASSSPAYASSSSSSSSSAASSPSSSSSPSSGSGWNRVAYYTPGSTTNCTFMNNQGGTAGSGTWSACFGNSISYAAADGVSGAGSPQALNQVTLASNKEYMIFSGTSCSDDSLGSCGYYRNDIPAYHGFGGATKIFVFEFTMPHDYSSSYNQDMPAVWLLNAKVPRTLQYGDSTCSCWSTGCGELDLFEILSSGSEKLITHLHDGQGNDGTSSGGGGTQDYFARPTSSSLKAAVIFNGNDKSIHVVEVSDDFDPSLSAETVNSWLDVAASAANLV
ncbi:LAMI_0E06590g1_1 [Lachancea mirantina]|uniref:glucan endo-1,3-beta-D-glucosidase n=1 Tax=Lachancea mirantina TaxID=1230905 RepID=A0A1G4JLW8_9SACH|nr:LAMI_0E06590g1_1 [Lachancea mirantina]